MAPRGGFGLQRLQAAIPHVRRLRDLLERIVISRICAIV
jgi:hypothetical protein